MGLSLQILLHLKVDVCESLEAVVANQGSGASPNTAAELWHLLRFRQGAEKPHILWTCGAARLPECPGVSQMTPGGFGIHKPHGNDKEMKKNNIIKSW